LFLGLFLAGCTPAEIKSMFSGAKEAWVGTSQDLHQQVEDMKTQDADAARGRFIGVVSRDELASGTAQAPAREGYFLRSFDGDGLCITTHDGYQIWQTSEAEDPERFVTAYQKDQWAAGSSRSLEEGFPAGTPWPRAASGVRVRNVKIEDEPTYAHDDPFHEHRPDHYWRKYTTEICVPAPPPGDDAKVVSLSRMSDDGKLIIAWRIED
jgi:hypothetical protein